METNAHDPSRSPICSITRFELRHGYQLIRAWAEARRIFHSIQKNGGSLGYLGGALSIQLPRTVFIVSLWESEKSLPRFWGLVPEHIAALRSLTSMTARAGHEPIMWSSTWTHRRSSSFGVWPGVNLPKSTSRSEQEAAR